MRIGINGSSLVATGVPLKQMVDHVVEAEAHGFSSYWIAQLAAPDALTAIAAMGARTETIEIGTAVVPTWLRHPLMLATQALTVQEAIANRLTLGIGLAHKAVIEAMLGVPFTRPAKHMEEYLDVLLPAMAERRVDATGEIWSGHIPTIAGMPDAKPPSVMLAAMGPRMVAMAGARTDGLILWLSGPRTIESTLKPAVDAAAAAVGRAAPRIMASVPVCVTTRADEVRDLIATFLAGYNDLPSYRGVMDIEGVDGPAGVSIVGTEADVRARVAAFAEAGATDFAAVEFTTDDTEQQATRALLKELAKEASA